MNFYLKQFKNAAVKLNFYQKRHWSSSLDEFKEAFKRSNHLVVLTGNGISIESGVPPMFQGEYATWKHYETQKLATALALFENPKLVWEFYQYRRDLIKDKRPNQAHYALVRCEKEFENIGKKFTLITINMDGLHRDAGSKNLIELHGNIFRSRCIECPYVEMISKSLMPTSNNEYEAKERKIPTCKRCKNLMRPDIVLFNEKIDPHTIQTINEELENCDFFIMAGTAGNIYPASTFANIVKSRRVPITNINIEEPKPDSETFYFRGPASLLLPACLL